jgi:hypothetical protein
MAAAGFLFILGLARASLAWAVRRGPCGVFRQELHLPIFSSLIFGAVRWAARKGLRGERDDASGERESPEEQGFPERKIAQNRIAERKLVAGRTGMRGERMRIGICGGMDMCLWREIICRAGRRVRST